MDSASQWPVRKTNKHVPGEACQLCCGLLIAVRMPIVKMVLV